MRAACAHPSRSVPTSFAQRARSVRNVERAAFAKLVLPRRARSLRAACWQHARSSFSNFTFAWGCPRLCFCVGSTATKPSQCTGTSGMAFGGVDEEASQLLATRTHVVTMSGLWVNFSLGLSSVMLLCWEYGHQTFSMHEYVEDGF
ncbi:unnamed protein product, partial [Prunus brigantina]